MLGFRAASAADASIDVPRNQDLITLLRARTPLLLIESAEETRVVDAFRRAYDDFRQSYVLHYSHAGPDAPAPQDGDDWHVIRVEVAKPGQYAIRAKKGYFGG